MLRQELRCGRDKITISQNDQRDIFILLSLLSSMAEIKYVGLEDLDLDVAERKRVEDEVTKHAKRIQQMVKNELELVIHLKPYHKTGERQKISVHIRATYPGGTVVSDKQHEWQLIPAIQAGMAAVEQQLERKFT